MFMSLTEINTTILLVVLGLGYIVCYLAEREEKTLRILGFGIGAFMIGFSLMIILSNAVMMHRSCRRMKAISHEMMMHKKMMMAPIPANMPAPAVNKK